MSQDDNSNERDFANDDCNDQGADSQPVDPQQVNPENPTSDTAPGEVGETTPAAEPAADVVTELYDLLGKDTVLLPVPERKKGPVIKGWQQTKLQDTQTPEYRAKLLEGNVGVLLGEPSNGLCTIDIDDEEAVEPFLANNPALQNTPRSSARRGAQIWLRVLGQYPPLTKIVTVDGKEFGEWRSTGGQSVVHGIHPEGMEYRRVCDGPIVTLQFDQIVWPENLKLPWIKTPYDLLVEEEGDPFLMGDNGSIKALNHAHFAARYQAEHTVLFDDGLKEFFGYDPKTGLWKQQTLETIKRQVSEDLKRTAREQAARELLAKRNDGLLNGIANLLRANVERHAAFRHRPTCIHVQNGVLRLDVDPPRLESFSPEFYSRNQCPIAYDPEAECPRFINELLRSALDDDDVALLQMWFGSVALGNNLAQRILLLTGTAGGGKSSLMNVLEEIIGRTNIAHLRTDQLAERFELFSFNGKSLLTGKDVSPKFLMQKGAHVLKALVGHDHVDAEKKGCNERVSLFGNFNVAITCNSRMRVRLEGDTDAWRRRLISINYNKPKPKQRIANFADTLLKEEGPGILRWMVDGAVLYLREVEAHGDLVLTAKQQQRVDALLAESDSIRHFLDHRVATDVTGDVTSRELVGAYRDYCETMEWEGYPDNEVERQLSALVLEAFGVHKRHDIRRLEATHRGYRGISLNI